MDVKSREKIDGLMAKWFDGWWSKSRQRIGKAGREKLKKGPSLASTQAGREDLNQ